MGMDSHEYVWAYVADTSYATRSRLVSAAIKRFLLLVTGLLTTIILTRIFAGDQATRIVGLVIMVLGMLAGAVFYKRVPAAPHRKAVPRAAAALTCAYLAIAGVVAVSQAQGIGGAVVAVALPLIVAGTWSTSWKSMTGSAIRLHAPELVAAAETETVPALRVDLMEFRAAPLPVDRAILLARAGIEARRGHDGDVVRLSDSELDTLAAMRAVSDPQSAQDV